MSKDCKHDEKEWSEIDMKGINKTEIRTEVCECGLIRQRLGKKDGNKT